MKFNLEKISTCNTTKVKEMLEELGFRYNWRVDGKWHTQDLKLGVEISNLEELQAFIDKWGDIIIEKSLSGVYTLTIYDEAIL